MKRRLKANPDLGASANPKPRPAGGSGRGEAARPTTVDSARLSTSELQLAYTLAVEREAAALRKVVEAVKSDPKWRDMAIEALKPQRKHEADR